MRQAPTTMEHRDTFERANPHLVNEVEDVHHAVPQAVLRKYPGRFTRAEIHSLANLRGLRFGQSKLHDQLGRRWRAFYRWYPTAEREQILRWAAKLDLEYGDSFLPRVPPPSE